MELLESHWHRIAAGMPVTNIAVHAIRISDGIHTVIEVTQLCAALGKHIGKTAYEINHPETLGQMVYPGGR